MSILTNPSAAFSTSLIYITAGTLMDIWSILSWYYYPPESDWGRFLVIGFIVTGFALLVIGLLLGPIGRAARHAELPPGEVTQAVANIDQTAAANPPAVVSTNAAMPVAPGGVPGTATVAAPPSAPPSPTVPPAAPIRRI